MDNDYTDYYSALQVKLTAELVSEAQKSHISNKAQACLQAIV